MRFSYYFVFLALIFHACVSKGSNNQQHISENKKAFVQPPLFNADSAYSYIARQVDFGPRVPNTAAHRQCAAYLADQLTNSGAKVIKQNVDLKAFNGDVLSSVNIIGSYQLEKKERIALFAHWDSRPWADHDPNPSNRNKPVDGANDGASGVGVLLEIARQLGQKNPEIGVDVIFFDAEDYGAPANFPGDAEDSWCLGAQHWSRNPHVPGYQARYGILLDMVGAPAATFYKEMISMNYAAHVVEKVWTTASTLGFGSYFLNENGGGITDDHLYVNQIAGIPTIDIIQYDQQGSTGFGEYWHTSTDNMTNIDKNTLSAVGTTLLHVIYNE